MKATGRSAAEISGIEKIELESEEWAYEANIERAIRRLIGTVNFGASYLDRSDMLEAVCRTLCMDFFADTFTPTGPADPDLETALQYLRRLSLNSTGEAQPYEEYLRHLGYCMKGRYFFTTKQGHIGLLPEAGKGDQVFVILGCQTPLLLENWEVGTWL